MKNDTRLLITAIAFLSFLTPVHRVLACSGEMGPSSGKPCISVTNFAQDQTVPPKPVRLKLHIVPAPSPAHPVHVHIYVNDKMSTMFTVRSQDATVILRHLKKGKNTITIVQADAKTHIEMDMGSMSGDMSGGMSGMAMPALPNASVAHLTLIVK